MKLNNLLLAAFFSLLAMGAILIDEWTYLIAALIATIALAVVMNAKTFVMALTRWSKANPGKTQILIVMMQLILITLAIMIGKNLRELEIFISNRTAYLFSAIVIAGFLMVPFKMKPSLIAIPKAVDRQRIIFMGITLSSFMLVIMMGNRIGDFFPNSSVTLAIEKIDHMMYARRLEAFAQLNKSSLGEYQPTQIAQPGVKLAVAPGKDYLNPNSILNAPIISKKDFRAAKKQFMKELRTAETKNMCALAIVLIILLVITTCAGICLLIAGIAGGSALAAIFGPIVAGASIYGIVKVAKWCRRDRTVNPT